MAGDFSKNNIEAEIAELSQRIAEKRRELERGKEIVEERELVKSALKEEIRKSAANIASGLLGPKPSTPSTGSYLDSLDEESRAEIERLVEEVFTKGLKKTLDELTLEEPFIIDTFHDVLTDRIYNELKKRGAI